MTTDPGAVCAVTRCDRPALWTVTIDGHPNAAHQVVARYCTEHAREKAAGLWEDSPRPYTITVHGPTAPAEPPAQYTRPTGGRYDDATSPNPWDWPDGQKRRLALGHQDEPNVPGYCTCGELAHRCPVRPREWASSVRLSLRPPD